MADEVTRQQAHAVLSAVPPTQETWTREQRAAIQKLLADGHDMPAQWYWADWLVRYEATVNDLEQSLETERAAGRLALGLLTESRRREALAAAVADATWELLNTSRDTPERSAAFKKVCLATAARNDAIEARGGKVKRDWGERGG